MAIALARWPGRLARRVHYIENIMATSRYAIVSDRTPSRCTIDEIIETEMDMLQIAAERDIPLSRIMWVRDDSDVAVGDRAWHHDDHV